eukprot:TRINITY_DN12080_c0_g1_i4.p1 TRINITY_DN12080_c0_g1~~TRINITY_DN12080_c0_g1_i4.p1  ORF type:complete len:304 (+),score=95.26 TRINITY_DN12080_c0_g1_i4:118-912(+)
MEERNELLQRALLAQKSELYVEMMANMRNLVESSGRLNLEERNLLSIAFRNGIEIQRSAMRTIIAIEGKEKTRGSKFLSLLQSYKKIIYYRIEDIASEIDHLIHEYLFKNLKDTAEDKKVQAFYFKMLGDYTRYRAEYALEEEKKKIGGSALSNYDQAIMCLESINNADPLVLGVALNGSVLNYDIIGNTEAGYRLAKYAFDSALGELDKLKGDEYNESCTLMKLLCDNLTLWKAEIEEKKAKKQPILFLIKRKKKKKKKKKKP